MHALVLGWHWEMALAGTEGPGERLGKERWSQEGKWILEGLWQSWMKRAYACTL